MDDIKKSEQRCPCTPEELFFTASTLSALLASSLSKEQLQTVLNLLTLVSANLSAIIEQQEICAGTFVETQE